MADWREQDHPRDSEGRFRDRVGGWVQTLSARLTGGGGETSAPERRDQTGLRDGLDWDAIQGAHDAYWDRQRKIGYKEHNRVKPGDLLLGDIYRQVGFHARPQVASRTEMDAAVQGGAIELWRGVKGVEGLSAGRMVEQFRAGDRHFPGEGFYGNGTYASPSRSVAEGYAESDPVGLMRLVLRPDARVISHDELGTRLARHFHLMTVEHQAARADIQSRYEARELTPVEAVEAGQELSRKHGIRMRALGDHGRYAAALGYDAISAGGMYVILNRGAVMVQR